MYATLLLVFILAVGANALIGRLEARERVRAREVIARVLRRSRAGALLLAVARRPARAPVRRPTPAGGDGAVRDRGRSADARSALRARRREQRRAAARAAGVRAVHRHRRSTASRFRCCSRAFRPSRTAISRATAARSSIICGRGVRWQDGVPVTADDVLFTLHAIVDPRNPVRSREGYDRVARATNGSTRRPCASCSKSPWAPAVATLFSYGTAPQYVLPAHLLAKEARLDRAAFGAAPVGNGPYRFVSWSRGDRLEYEANPAYWRGAPKVARLDIRVVPDPGTNFTSLMSGALDWNLISPVQQRAILGRPGIAFRYVPLALIAGHRDQHGASAARRRARAPRDRGVDRSPSDQRQDHVQALSGRRHGAAARLVGARSGGAAAGDSIPRARTRCSTRPAGCAAPTACA